MHKKNMIEILKQNKELWDIFTREEEYDPLLVDQYGRFPYYLSKHRNIFEPVVSKFLIENCLNVDYPDGKKFAVCLTHDIDVVSLSKSSIILNTARSLKERQLKSAFKILFNNVNKDWNPWWNFEDIMALEDKYDAKSGFYFLTLSEEEQDFNFKVENLEHEMGNIADKGWEVGLHGGHEAYNNCMCLAETKKTTRFHEINTRR